MMASTLIRQADRGYSGLRVLATAAQIDGATAPPGGQAPRLPSELAAAGLLGMAHRSGHLVRPSAGPVGSVDEANCRQFSWLCVAQRQLVKSNHRTPLLPPKPPTGW